jgi:hypothetical protein
MKTHFIIAHGELAEVEIDRICDLERDGRSGIIFRGMSGKSFFLQYHQFSFYVPCSKN